MTKTPQTEAPLKTEGDKLAGAAGAQSRPRDASDDRPRPEEESLKVHGDKLQTSVDKAAGEDR